MVAEVGRSLRDAWGSNKLTSRTGAFLHYKLREYSPSLNADTVYVKR